MSDSKSKDDRTQLTLRLPQEIYEALKEEAEAIGISVNELILLKINPLKFDCSEKYKLLHTDE